MDQELPKQPFTDGAGGFPGFDLAFAQRGAGSGGVRFGPNERPGAVLVSEFAQVPLVCRIVVLAKAVIEVVGVSDVETSLEVS